MLAAEESDELSICTPSGAHLDPACTAPQRGIDILCEKPLEITTERIDRMCQAAAENDHDDQIREEFGEETEPGSGAADPMSIGYTNHRRNIADFIDSLDTSEYMLDATEARKAVEIIEAIYESAESRTPIRISE